MKKKGKEKEEERKGKERKGKNPKKKNEKERKELENKKKRRGRRREVNTANQPWKEILIAISRGDQSICASFILFLY